MTRNFSKNFFQNFRNIFFKTSSNFFKKQINAKKFFSILLILYKSPLKQAKEKGLINTVYYF